MKCAAGGNTIRLGVMLSQGSVVIDSERFEARFHFDGT